ncbi:hypothetical protein MVEN_02219200 [Mycena venus]|uniref:Uncharacterized protein n=1 Tax=Mycena venus TaxID=2733690 RepID=A0A8H6X6W0_9AGAR|nr:hypothetical protein MVEN_02219200 [Mycena venus]
MPMPPATWAAPPVMGVTPAYTPISRSTGGVLSNPATAARAAPPLTVEPVARPPSRQMMGGIIGNPASGAHTAEPVARPSSRLGFGNPASGFTVEPVVRPSSRLGNPAGGYTAEPVVRPSSRLGNPASGFTVEPVARPSSRLGNPSSRFTAESAPMGGIYGNPASGSMAGPPPNRLGNPPGTFTVEPVRPPSRQGGGIPVYPGNAGWGNPMGPPQQPSGPPGPGQMGGPPGGNWSMGGPYAFGQSSTPGNQPSQPLGFPAPSIGNAGVAPHSPLPTHPQSFVGTDNPPLRSTTPRPIYGPPATNAPFGTGYGAPTPGVAAGYPLPTSRSNSTATTTPHQRIANLNAGTTPAAAFNSRALSRPTSRASSGGYTRHSSNQTPHPGANLGITNPYTSIQEESPGSDSDSTRSSLGLARMNSFDRMTANNTLANANASYTGVPVIPPSPANSYRPMR